MAKRSHKSIRWLLVPSWAVWTIFLTAGAFWLLQLTFNLWIRHVVAPLIEYDDLVLAHSVHVFALALFAVALAFYRSVWLHPVMNTAYGAWLAQTPWQYPQPLPLGPVKLVWQDLLLVSAMTLMAFVPPHRDGSPFLVPILFFAAYSVGMCIVHFRADIRWPTYACLSVAWSTLIFGGHPTAIAVALVGIVCLATLPIIGTLSEFPFSSEQRAKLKLLPYTVQPPVTVHWPASSLCSFTKLPKVSIGEATAVSATAGWLMFCASFPCRELSRTDDNMLLVLRVNSAAVAIGRLFIYCRGCWPPISIVGRVATRRWIVPGYDMVFVAPLAAIGAAYFLPKLFLGVGTPAILAVPLVTSVTVWLALALPPSLEDWYYRGHYREPLQTLNSQLTVRS